MPPFFSPLKDLLSSTAPSGNKSHQQCFYNQQTGVKAQGNIMNWGYFLYTYRVPGCMLSYVAGLQVEKVRAFL